MFPREGSSREYWRHLSPDPDFDRFSAAVDAQGKGALRVPLGVPLGSLSSRYESNGQPGAVSSGSGDHGGVSYGAWQMASNMGVPQDFLRGQGSAYAAAFANATPGDAAFSSDWQAVAARDPQGFLKAQYDFIKATDYDRQMARVARLTGLDPKSFSDTLNNVIWSTAVQHGAKTDIVANVLAGLPGSPGTRAFDEAAINAIYDERGRRNKAGGLVHFPSSSAAFQAGVAERYQREKTKALGWLNQEYPSSR